MPARSAPRKPNIILPPISSPAPSAPRRSSLTSSTAGCAPAIGSSSAATASLRHCRNAALPERLAADKDMIAKRLLAAALDRQADDNVARSGRPEWKRKARSTPRGRQNSPNRSTPHG